MMTQATVGCQLQGGPAPCPGGPGAVLCAGFRAEWNRDDSWVYALDVEKELVDERGETEVEVFLQEELDRAN